MASTLFEYTECQAFSPCSRPNWLHLLPHQQASVSPLSIWFRGGGGIHSLAGEGAGEANTDEGTDTLIVYLGIP